mgnify:CR=1 FL=1
MMDKYPYIHELTYDHLHRLCNCAERAEERFDEQRTDDARKVLTLMLEDLGIIGTNYATTQLLVARLESFALARECLEIRRVRDDLFKVS